MNDHDGDGRPPLLHTAELREGDETLARAVALVRFLRTHCPWDAKQTPQTLRPYLLEEAHEVADAIRSEDDASLASELGDLLLNVAFQMVLAEERGTFDATGVVEAMERKMIARHPHIYGDADEPPDWEAMKAAEREAEGRTDEAETDPFAGVSRGLDPLSRAARVQERMAAVGFDWPDIVGPLEKVREEAGELAEAMGVEPDATFDPSAEATSRVRIGDADARVTDEVGDLLFAAVNASRLAGAHPANALLGAIEKFEARCRRMIERAQASGIDWETAGLERLDRLWDEVKAEEAQSSASSASEDSASS